jgi:hypothetical protein
VDRVDSRAGSSGNAPCRVANQRAARAPARRRVPGRPHAGARVQLRLTRVGERRDRRTPDVLAPADDRVVARQRSESPGGARRCAPCAARRPAATAVACERRIDARDTRGRCAGDLTLGPASATPPKPVTSPAAKTPGRSSPGARRPPRTVGVAHADEPRHVDVRHEAVARTQESRTAATTSFGDSSTVTPSADRAGRAVTHVPIAYGVRRNASRYIAACSSVSGWPRSEIAKSRTA